ncbi:MAG: U32 family peptidase [Clostridia bacterium]|nr:U32 family peptidase [Clostridia bacterium]
MKQHSLPELLCPAGTPLALDAAIEGGADAVYFGASQFNARMHAENFGGDALRSAVLRAHAYGVKTYLTLNTLVTDRELPAFLDSAREAARAGVDGLIVADMGGAAAIHRILPSLELHASTQLSGHNSEAAKLLASLGYTRMVAARESSLENIRAMVEMGGIEIELFVHGALCVCHSGQCLFSSLVGGRSGNRGECAQPCRLPYSTPRGEGYPLSLKDLSLCDHIPEILDLGVASLKIEGRMKSPEYVRDTTRLWRKLLDEGRSATKEEKERLAATFSRSGFTDGYFVSKIDRSMMGVRTEADKQKTSEVEPFSGLVKKVPLDLHLVFKKDQPTTLTIGNGKQTVVVSTDAPEPARSVPMDEDALKKNLCRLGGTPYEVASFSGDMDSGLMLPLSGLNDLRRRGVAALEEAARPIYPELPYEPKQPKEIRKAENFASFRSAEQITPAAIQFFSRRFLPLFEYNETANGVILPPVLFDSDLAAAKEALKAAKANGAEYALVGNLGHLSLVKEVGLAPVGDFRLNCTNRESVRFLEELGVKEVILSPELTLPQARDVGGDSALLVYGRIPLMVLEKCVSKEISDCKTCQAGYTTLCDRRGVTFPVTREYEHRNVIYNSLPTSMSDKIADLDRARISSRYFLFSVETPNEVDEVIGAFEAGSPLPFPVRRIGS